MMAFSEEPGKPAPQQPVTRSVPPPGRWGWILGAVAVSLVLVLGFLLWRSLGRMQRQVSRLGRQTDQLTRRTERAERQSEQLAQQAMQAAADAQAAARARDQAKQAQALSQAQARSALEQAASERQKASRAAQLANQARQQAQQAEQRADQATRRAEEYRRQREAELARLQQLFGRIADTRRTAMGLVMTLGNKSVRFDFDQALVKPQYRDILNRIAGVLLTLKGYSIYVYGYTDDVGTQDYNLKLSRHRAEAVRDVLVQAGIDPRIITTKGFGKSDPRVPGDSQQARAANRRVEIGIVDSRLLLDNRLVLDQ